MWIHVQTLPTADFVYDTSYLLGQSLALLAQWRHTLQDSVPMGGDDPL